MTVEPRTARVRAGRRRLSRKEAQALTRRRVLDAAADVFGERGFQAASMADVADRAGYTIGAVYSNFANKESLFHELMEERLREVEAALDADERHLARDRRRRSTSASRRRSIAWPRRRMPCLRGGGGSSPSSGRSRPQIRRRGPTSPTPSAGAG